MKLNQLLSASGKHALAIVLFLVVSFAYFSPVFEGKVLFQNDVKQAEGSQQELVKYNKETGKYSLWTNSMFGGMPTYQIGNVGAPDNNIYHHINKLYLKLLPNYSVDILVLYMIGFYFLLLVLGLNTGLSIAGAIAFAFSTYNVSIIGAGHVNKAYAIAMMAPILAGIIMTFRGKYIWGFIVTAISLGIQLAFNHLQMTYYLMIMILIYGCFELYGAIKNKSLKNFYISSACLLVALVFAILPNVTNLRTTAEYSKYTMRGGSDLTTPGDKKQTGLDKEYAYDYSYGKSETFTLLVPNFHGGASVQALSTNSNLYKELTINGVSEKQAKDIIKQVPTYWGNLIYIAAPIYFGAIICFLFVLGLFVVKSNYKWWLLISTMLAIMLSWGNNFEWFSNLFFNYFPMYNKFRAVMSILVISSVAFPILGFLGLREIFEKTLPKGELLKALKNSFYITGGVLVLLFIASGFSDFVSPNDAQYTQAGYPEWFVNAIQSDRASIYRMDVLRSLIFISLTFAILWAYLAEKLEAKYFSIAIGLLILIDLFAVNKRYLNNNDFATKQQVGKIQPTQADLQILQDRDPDFRVFNLTSNPFNEASTSYFHKSIGGYHGAKLSRYQDIISKYLSASNMNVINMLNTKYFITAGPDKQPMARYNPDAMGNAWFVNTIEWVDNANQEIDAIGTVNLKDTVVIDKQFKSVVGEFSAIYDTSQRDNIVLTDYKPDHLTYSATTKTNRLVVFSEIYYDKGWNAYINGNPVTHFRVNYILRGVVVPAGNNKIEFKFEPKTFYSSQKIALASSLIMLLILIGAIGYSVKTSGILKQKG